MDILGRPYIYMQPLGSTLLYNLPICKCKKNQSCKLTVRPCPIIKLLGLIIRNIHILRNHFREVTDGRSLPEAATYVFWTETTKFLKRYN